MATYDPYSPSPLPSTAVPPPQPPPGVVDYITGAGLGIGVPAAGFYGLKRGYRALRPTTRTWTSPLNTPSAGPVPSAGRGIASRLPSWLSRAPVPAAGAGATGATGAATASAGAVALPIAGGAAAGLGSAALLNGTGLTGGDSGWEQALEGGAAGAAVGTGVGLAGGPFAPISVPVGAAVGAGLGAAGNLVYGLFQNGDGRQMKDVNSIIQNTPEIYIPNVINTAVEGGLLPPGTTPDKYLAYYDVLSAMSDNSPESKAAIMSQINELINQDIGMGMNGAPSPQDILTQQAYVANAIAPMMESMQSNNAARTGALQSMVGDLPPEYRQLTQIGLADQGLANDTLISAYAAQAALVPQTLAMEQSIQQSQGIAQQIQQQAMNSIMYPPAPPTAPTSADSLSALLAAQPQG